MTSQKVLNVIEFDKILNIASSYAVSDIGKEFLLSTLPVDDFEQANQYLDQTYEAYRILYEKSIDPIGSFDDIEELISKAKINAILSCADLLKIGRSLKSVQRIIAKIKPLGEEFRLIQNIVADMTNIKSLSEDIEVSILDENEVSDGASEKLASIRRKIAASKANIKEKLNSIIRSSTYSKYLQDNIITVRNDRFVIPVKNEYRGEINGLLHDQSASGATAFIEPMQVVELNNQLKSLLIDEQIEIERILTALTLQVNNNADVLLKNQKALILLDAIFAKARYAEHIKAIRPILKTDYDIKIVQGRHPLIAAEKVVPIDIELGGKHKILIISGPNTGGKTVTLKTVGLFSVMAASGFMLPAKEVSMPVFESLYCDIGDFQSIENSLSTYSSHIQNLVNITDNMSAGSLVLIDEIGAGTDPSEGAALAIGIIKYMLKIGVLGIVTTHYSELKEFCLTNPNIRNASMEFDFKTLLPTYKIMMDLPGTSNALAIARHLGLNSEILNDAKNAIDEEKHNFENVLRLARSLKSQAEKEYEEAKKEREKLQEEIQEIAKEKERITQLREKINNQADREVKEIIMKKTAQANDYLERLKEIVNKAELDESEILKAKQLRTAIENQLYDNSSENVDYNEVRPINEKEIQVGINAYIKTLQKECVILSLPDRKNCVDVSVGNMRLNIKLEDLGVLKHPTIKSEKKESIILKRAASKNNVTVSDSPVTYVSSEINLLGNTVDEAVAKLDVFLDNAVRNGLNEVKIVHGKGTGALRRGVHDYLKINRLVSGFRLGMNNEGGSGVTIVTLS
ncbi:MAG TPA: endonuclease MutS2 [Clostridia bacterium]